MNKKTLIGLIVIFITLAVGAKVFFLADSPLNNFIPTQDLSHSVFDGKNATFNIEKEPITLTNGISEKPAAPDSASKIITRYFGNEAIGDINRDGLSDTAFLVTQESGGTGIFYYVVVAIQTAKGYQLTDAFLIGDRIAPQTTKIEADTLLVNFSDRKQDEPMSTPPSLGKTLLLTVTQKEELELGKIIYKNDEYGFMLSLPGEWQNYTVASEAIPYGEKIVIRHPQWIKTDQYEDIPILIYPIAQWKKWEINNFEGYPTAAPFGPTERARNDRSVFATAPRYNYDYQTGWEEVENIIKTMKAF